MRQAFLRATEEMLDADPDVAVVLADISAAQLAGAARRHPDRVINVGIREQLLVSAGAGLALAGLRPIVHTFPSFPGAGGCCTRSRRSWWSARSSRSSWTFRTRTSAGSWCRTGLRTTCRPRGGR